MPDVLDAREFLFHTVQREHHGKPLRIAVLGLGWPTDKGEWVPLLAGRPLAANHFEMIADRTLGLRLGEQVRLGKENYTVVGVSTGMISSAGDGIAFFTATDAQVVQFDMPGEATRLEREARRVRGEQSEAGTSQPLLVEQAQRPSTELPAIALPQLSAVMVRVAPGSNLSQVAATFSGWADVSVYTQQEQREFLLKGSVEKVRRQIGLFTVLLTVIAGIIMALILYTLTLDKLHVHRPSQIDRCSQYRDLGFNSGAGAPLGRSRLCGRLCRRAMGFSKISTASHHDAGRPTPLGADCARDLGLVELLGNLEGHASFTQRGPLLRQNHERTTGH